MKIHAAADDRQRVIHDLVREVAEADADMTHLTTEDLAALVSGTLFKTECSRIENHLLSCPECAARAHQIHDEVEAGVVPILLRRAVPLVPAESTLPGRLTRRWAPWILGILAALLALSFSATSFWQCGAPVQQAKTDLLVSERLGTPFRGADDASGIMKPIEPGTWLNKGDILKLNYGDWIRAIDRDGAFWEVDSKAQWKAEQARTFSSALARGAWQARPELLRESKENSASPTASKSRLHIIHPRQDIYETRPHVRWGGTRAARKYMVRIYPLDHALAGEIYEVETRGRSLPWPVSKLPLKPGITYTVEVLAESGANAISASEEINVVAGERRERIKKDLEAVEQMVGKRPNILRAELLRQHGLHAECREELERLRVTETENVSLLRRLRVAFKALGLTEEASRMSRLIGKRR